MLVADDFNVTMFKNGGGIIRLSAHAIHHSKDAHVTVTTADYFAAVASTV